MCIIVADPTSERVQEVKAMANNAEYCPSESVDLDMTMLRMIPLIP